MGFFFSSLVQTNLLLRTISLPPLFTDKNKRERGWRAGNGQRHFVLRELPGDRDWWVGCGAAALWRGFCPCAVRRNPSCITSTRRGSLPSLACAHECGVGGVQQMWTAAFSTPKWLTSTSTLPSGSRLGQRDQACQRLNAR